MSGLRKLKDTLKAGGFDDADYSAPAFEGPSEILQSETGPNVAVLTRPKGDANQAALAETQDTVEKSETLLLGVFGEHQISAEHLRAAAQARAAILNYSSKTIEAYLEIGKRLIHLRESLGNDMKAYNIFVENRTAFQFGKNFAFKITALVSKLPVVADVLGVHLAEVHKHLPAAVTAAYLLTTFSKDEMRDAKRAGLIAPDTTREQIEQFRAVQEHPTNVLDDATNAYYAQREKLEGRISRLRKKLREAEHNLAQLEADWRKSDQAA